MTYYPYVTEPQSSLNQLQPTHLIDGRNTYTGMSPFTGNNRVGKWLSSYLSTATMLGGNVTMKSKAVPGLNEKE